jgi:hypothetical protein
MQGRWNCRILSLLGVLLGLGLTLFFFRDLTRWPTDWILFLEEGKRPSAGGFGPWGKEVLEFLNLKVLSEGRARTQVIFLFGVGWILVFLLLPLKGWKRWESILWGTTAGSTLFIVAEGPAILGNRSIFLPFVFLIPLLLLLFVRTGPNSRSKTFPRSITLGFVAGLVAGMVSLCLLGRHFPWGEMVLLFSFFAAKGFKGTAFVSGGAFLLSSLGLPLVLNIPPVFDPVASLVDLLGPGPAWRGSLFQLVPAALGLRVSLGSLQRPHPIFRSSLAMGVSLFLVLGIGNFVRWKKISNHLQFERRALTTALSKIPSVGTVLVWNLPSFLRADLAVQIMGPPSRFLLLRTWDLGEEVHIPEGWNYSETTPVLRWTQKGFVAIRFEDCLLLPPFPLALEGGFVRNPLAMIRMGKVPETQRLDEEVEVDWGEEGVQVRLLGEGRKTPFALALLSGSREVYSPSKHTLGSLSEGWFSLPFPQFKIQGSGSLVDPKILPGIGPWVQGKNPQAAFRVRVLR